MHATRLGFIICLIIPGILGAFHHAPPRHHARARAVHEREMPRPRFPRPLVNRLIMAETERVHACEEGSYGWHVNGPTYFGGLGWLWATWQTFRRHDFPVSMADATPQQQAWAMARFAFQYGWPDQNGCWAGGY